MTESSFKNSFSADFNIPNKSTKIAQFVNDDCAVPNAPPPVHSQPSPSVDIVVVDKSSAALNANTHAKLRSNTKSITTKDNNNLLGLPSSASTCETSENDNISADVSLESFDVRMWNKTESDQVSVAPSFASSISLDTSQSDEAVLEFMRRFVMILFTDCSSITLELKSEFGQYSRMEAGRMWFARLVNAQRAKTKRVDETTFYALIQHFAIVLFECTDSEDFSPAKSLMNMCFTFFHEVEVPGCEPYREYLYTYLREQPIWHSLRFWNAAFFDALQLERCNKPVPPTHSRPASRNIFDLDEETNTIKTVKSTLEKNNSLPISDNDLSLSSSSSSANSDDGVNRNLGVNLKQDSKQAVKKKSENILEIIEDKKFQQNITFGQLGQVAFSA